jgi:serine-type D-Ala-D-Ala carboxypeptidase (penicillin-binding protein 5/6)
VNSRPAFSRIQLLIGVITIGLLLMLPSGNNLRPTSTSALSSLTQEWFLSEVSPVPILKGSDDRTVFLATQSASAVYVMDVDSGAVLLAKNEQELRFPASTTKLMSALVAREKYSLDQILTVDEQSLVGGTSIDLVIGEQFTVEALLKAVLLNSANNAATVLAAAHPGGLVGFTNEMNSTADRLSLQQTNFTNPAGLDSFQQQISARDLAILAKEVMKDPFLKQIVGTQQTVITSVNTQRPVQLKSTNQLLGNYPGVIGIKTGTTSQAGETLVTEIDRDGRRIILVVMGSSNRYQETTAMIEWVFGRYQWFEEENSVTISS